MVENLDEITEKSRDSGEELDLKASKVWKAHWGQQNESRFDSGLQMQISLIPEPNIVFSLNERLPKASQWEVLIVKIHKRR